jgi:NUMOD4 motif/HNH endonuclease/CENP-B N-terminal DNA-binding domain
MATPLLLDYEEWRTIKEWPKYEVSSFGRVRSFAGKKINGIILKESDVGGYGMVTLCRDGIVKLTKVATIVCVAFHGPRPSLTHQVAHGDGYRKNNNKRNLRWATPKENGEDRVRHGRSNRGTENRNSVLSEQKVRSIRRLLAEGVKKGDIATQFNVCRKTIDDILKKKTWFWLI